MKPNIAWKFLFAFAALMAVTHKSSDAANFTPGNIVVYRIGDGSTALTGNAAPVSLLEFKPDGTLDQTINLPTTGSNRFTNSGSAASNGYHFSNGAYLAVPGHDADAGTASVASANNKVTLIFGVDGTVSSRTAHPTDASIFGGNNYRGAVAMGSNLFYAAGTGSGSTGGVWYYNGTGFSQIISGNLRNVAVFGGRLFYSTGSGTSGIYQFATALPTSTSTSTLVAGASSPYGFVVLDTNEDTTPDTMYVASDSAGTAGGLFKFTYNTMTSAWDQAWLLRFNTSTNTLTTDAATGSVTTIRGLTGVHSAGTTTLYATTSDSPNRLVRVVDSGSTPGAFTTLATAGTNFIFRGVTFAPVAPTPPIPALTSTTPADGATGIAVDSTITLNFNKPVNLTASAVTIEAPTGTPVAFTGLPTTSAISSVVLTPSANLPFNTAVTVSVIADQVTDEDSNAMAADEDFTFNTLVPVPPEFTTPGDQTIAQNASATLNVNVTAGTAPLTYRWYQGMAGDTTTLVREVEDTAATTDSFSTPSLTTTTQYWLRVTNAAGQSTDSGTITITVNALPFIASTVPADAAINVLPGTTITLNFSKPVTLTVDAVTLTEGMNSVSFTGLPVTTPTASVVLTPVDPLLPDTTYTVTVLAAEVEDEDSNNPAADYDFQFTTLTPVTITDQPDDTSTPSGGSASFTVTATGTGPLNYDWLFNGASIGAPNSNTLSLASVSAADVGLYSVIVSGPGSGNSVTSAPAYLNVTGAATITQWNFNGSSTTTVPGGTASPTPSTGTGTASLVGGATASFASGIVNGGSSDPVTTAPPNYGWNLTSFPVQGAGDRTAGARFLVSTAGFSDIQVRWDRRNSNTSARHQVFQYTLDGGATWTEFGGFFLGTAGDTWFNNNSVDLSSIPGANNNPNFGFRLLAAHNPDTGEYTAASTTYASSGTWRFDMVTVTGNQGALSVQSTSPLAGAVDVPVTSPIVLHFNRPAGFQASAITLDAEGDPVAFTGMPAANVAVSTLTLTPTPRLPYGKTIALTLDKTKVLAGADGLAEDFILTFNTEASTPPAFTQPDDQLITAGATATLSTTVTAGTAPLTYRWYQGAAGDTTTLVREIIDTNDTTDSFTTPTLTSTTSYWLRVTNAAGESADSATITITVTALPFLTGTSPANGATAVALNSTVTLNFSEPVTLTADAVAILDGINPVSFSGLPVTTPATTVVLTPDSLLPSNRLITVEITADQVADADANPLFGGNTSFDFTTVENLAITQQPIPQTVAVGSTAVFTVAVSGSGPFDYDWRRNSVSLGAPSSSTLTLTGVDYDDLGFYSVVVTGPGVGNTETSQDAFLNVVPQGNRSVVTQWNFNGPSTSEVPGGTNSPSPSIGSGTASLVGGATATFASGTVNLGSTDPVTSTPPNYAWNTTSFPAQSTGNATRGVQFLVDTTGHSNIVISWDQRLSNTSARHAVFLYTTDGGTTWTQFGGILTIGTAGDSWFNTNQVDLSSVPEVNNNPQFGFRILSSFAPNETAYIAANATSSYGGGTWRFDMVTVSSTSGSGSNLVWNEPGDGLWDVQTSLNWRPEAGGAPVVFDNGLGALFIGPGGVITIDNAGVLPFDVTVAQGDYTFTGGPIGGDARLVVTAGALTLQSPNTFAGGTQVIGGDLSISSAAQLGGGSLVLEKGSLEIRDSIQFAQGFNIHAGGTSTLDTNTHQLRLSGSSAVRGTLHVIGGGGVIFDNLPSMGGTGSFLIDAGSFVRIDAPSGVLSLIQGGDISGDLVLNTTARVNFNGTFTGAGVIKVIGPSGLTINNGAFSAFTPLISNLNAGVSGVINAAIQLNADNQPFTPGVFNPVTGEYTAASHSVTIGATNVANPPTPGSGLTLNGPISGDSDLFISNQSVIGGGSGTLRLNAQSTYAGNTHINTNNGNETDPVILGIHNALPPSTMLLFGTLWSTVTDPFRNPALDLNGFNQTVAAIADGSAAHPSSVGYNIVITNNGATPSTFTVDGSVSTRFTGRFTDGATSTLALVKDGTSTLTLTAPSTFSGGTTIAGGGILAANGTGSALGSGPVTIEAGGLLGGAGAVAGSVSATGLSGDPASIVPGPAGLPLGIEDLEIGGNLTLGAHSEVVFRVNGLGHTKLTVIGDITSVDSTTVFRVIFEDGFVPGPGAVFNLLDFANGPVTGDLDWSDNLVFEGLGSATVDFNTSLFTSTGVLAVNGSATALQFTTQPASQNLQPGQTLTLTAAVSGTAPYFFQWFKKDLNGVPQPIPGARGSQFIIASVGFGDAGAYLVRVGNGLEEIQSNDAVIVVSERPVITQQPAPLTEVLVGANVQLTVTATGPGTLSYSWRRNGAPLGAPNSPTLTLNNITAAQAGTYTVVVSNFNGDTESDDAVVVVNVPAFITTPPQSRAAAEGVDVTFTVVADGTPTLAYKWFFDDVEINGETDASLTVTAGPATYGAYRVEVSNGFGAPATATAQLTPPKAGPPNQRPEWDLTGDLAGGKLPDAQIGRAYSAKPMVLADDPANNIFRSADRFSATGLPAGLTINRDTGEISGLPAAIKPSPYKVRITARNAFGAVTIAVDLLVNPLPTGTTGTFTGVVERSELLANIPGDTNGPLGGRIDFTIGATGRGSGRITFGTRVYPFRGALVMVDPDDPAQVKMTVNIRRPRPASLALGDIVIQLTITGTGVLTDASVTDGTAATAALIRGWRNPWSRANRADAIAGYYTLKMDLIQPNAPYTSAEAPLGASYLSFTISPTTGRLTLRGRMADGATITLATFAGPAGQIMVFRTLYAATARGSILGMLEIEALPNPLENTLAGNLDWMRPANPARSNRLYRNGFPDLLDLEATGGRYNAPAKNVRVLGLTETENLVEVLFSEAGVETALPLATADGMKGVVAANNRVTFSNDFATVNTRRATLSFTAKTGAFRATIRLVEDNPLLLLEGRNVPVTRTVTALGLIVGDKGEGYFILNQLPAAPGETPSNTAQQGGKVVVQPAAP